MASSSSSSAFSSPWPPIPAHSAFPFCLFMDCFFFVGQARSYPFHITCMIYGSQCSTIPSCLGWMVGQCTSLGGRRKGSGWLCSYLVNNFSANQSNTIANTPIFRPTTYAGTRGKSLRTVDSVSSGPASTSEAEYAHGISRYDAANTCRKNRSWVISPNRPLPAYCCEWSVVNNAQVPSVFCHIMLGGVTRNRRAIPPAENSIICVEMTRHHWSRRERKQQKEGQHA